MANITKEIESLRAKIAQLVEEQEKAEQQEKALATVKGQIDELLKGSGLNLEDYVRSDYTKINRIVTKIEREKAKSAPLPAKSVGKKRASTKKRRARGKPAKPTVKIPAGKYGNLPSAPDQIFEVKEKGPRPKILKAYAEEIGHEAFIEQCQLET